MSHRKTLLRAAAIAAVAMTATRTAGAQAWNHPSFQQPTVTGREFNFGVADGGNAGTSFLFQWREGISAENQLSLDVGLADPDCPAGASCDSQFLIGGQFAHQLARANAQMPFDFLFTAGLNGGFGNNVSVIRIPVGVSVGHRFALDGGMAITPYVHPRISIDHCGKCTDETDVALNFDLGANFELNPQFALRASVKLGGSQQYFDDDALGISLAWTPPGLRR